jgi:hypothetical protein
MTTTAGHSFYIGPIGFWWRKPVFIPIFFLLTNFTILYIVHDSSLTLTNIGKRVINVSAYYTTRGYLLISKSVVIVAFVIIGFTTTYAISAYYH